MTDRSQKGYYCGYADGYRDGMADSQNRQIKNVEILHMPIEAMELSTRASGCLRYAGCVRIQDAVDLSEEKIRTIHGLGKVSAAEIANWMLTQGILYSAWNKYL